MKNFSPVTQLKYKDYNMAKLDQGYLSFLLSSQEKEYSYHLSIALKHRHLLIKLISKPQKAQISEIWTKRMFKLPHNCTHLTR